MTDLQKLREEAQKMKQTLENDLSKLPEAENNPVSVEIVEKDKSPKKETKAVVETNKPVKKNKGGQPEKYKPEYIKKIKEYLALAQDTEGKGKVKVNLPTIEGFCQYIEVPRTTVYEWINRIPEFSYTIKAIEVEQKKRLIDGGLGQQYNANMAKFLLSANHGMTEKTESKNVNINVSLADLFETVNEDN